jgi:hypothetical protein
MHKKKLTAMEQISDVMFLWRTGRGVIKQYCARLKYLFPVLTAKNYYCC